MKEIIDLQKKIVPEALTILEKRYNILRNILTLQPIGRRNLANKLFLGERVIRTEVDILKNQGLVDVNAAGMTVTHEGEMVVEKLKDFIYAMRGITEIQERLQKKLGTAQVVVVPGNIEEDEFVLDDLGKAAAKIIEKRVVENNIKNNIIGITGGTTMAAVAKGIGFQNRERNITVVPARGSLGKQVSQQANTIAAEIAGRLKGNYLLLHASETLSHQALESLLQDPEIQRVISFIKSAGLLVFGIGRADTMAKRRDLPEEIVEKLRELHAVSEAFGYYFNRNGEIIHESRTMGINLEDYKKIPHAIGVAGGPEKAEAILAITSLKKDMTLVIDEGAAMEIIKNF